MNFIKTILIRFRGYETFPVMTIDFDGDVRFRTMRKYKTEAMAVRDWIGTWKEALPDGTISGSGYMTRWKRL